jgi:hypothetical protein
MSHPFRVRGMKLSSFEEAVDSAVVGNRRANTEKFCFSATLIWEILSVLHVLSFLLFPGALTIRPEAEDLSISLNTFIKKLAVFL